MTFEQFQATKRESTDLEADTGISIYDNPDTKVPGLIYQGGLHIESRHDNWPEASKKEGRYYLCILKQEWITDDLAVLERQLYDFAIGEELI